MTYLLLAVLLTAAVGLTVIVAKETECKSIPSLVCISFTCIAIACLIAGMRGGS